MFDRDTGGMASDSAIKTKIPSPYGNGKKQPPISHINQYAPLYAGHTSRPTRNLSGLRLGSDFHCG